MAQFFFIRKGGKFLVWRFLILTGCTTFVHAVQHSVTAEQKVFDHIFSNYNNFVRPVSSHSRSAVNVTLEPVLYDILESRWKDERLVWKVEDFNGVESIRIPVSEIWHPDIAFYEMIELNEPIKEINTLAQISSSGDVFLTRIQNVKIHCSYDVAPFPFDRQNCSLRFVSWSYIKTQLDLYPNSWTGDTSHFQDNTEWTLISFNPTRTTATYAAGLFVEVTYTLIIQRKPQYYMLNLIAPTFIIISLSTVGLFSPSSSTGERNEKVNLGMTSLLTMAIMLLMISTEMPKTSSGMPLIGLFFMIELLLSSVMTLTAVGVMYIHCHCLKKEKLPPSWCLKALWLQKDPNLTKNAKCDNDDTVDRRCQDDLRKTAQKIVNTLDSHQLSKDLEARVVQLCDQIDFVCLCFYLFIHCLITAVILLAVRH